MKVKKLGFGLSTFIALSVIPISVVTMPLVLNQPVYAQALSGAIFDKWVSLGGSSSPLGSPTSNELPAARGGRYNEFQNGYIYSLPSLGAHAVYGYIGVKWNQLKRENGLAGYPITDELPADNGGRYNDFEKASIYWHPSIGAYAVSGDIRTKWVSLGRERSVLGYPISDEQPIGSAGVRVSYFQKGALYWNPSTRQVTVIFYESNTSWLNIFNSESGLG